MNVKVKMEETIVQQPLYALTLQIVILVNAKKDIPGMEFNVVV